MNINTFIILRATGTSEGVKKAWDTRGRGRKPSLPKSIRLHYMDGTPYRMRRERYHTDKDWARLITRMSRLDEEIEADRKNLSHKDFIAKWNSQPKVVPGPRGPRLNTNDSPWVDDADRNKNVVDKTAKIPQSKMADKDIPGHWVRPPANPTPPPQGLKRLHTLHDDLMNHEARNQETPSDSVMNNYHKKLESLYDGATALDRKGDYKKDLAEVRQSLDKMYNEPVNEDASDAYVRGLGSGGAEADQALDNLHHILRSMAQGRWLGPGGFDFHDGSTMPREAADYIPGESKMADFLKLAKWNMPASYFGGLMRELKPVDRKYAPK